MLLPSLCSFHHVSSSLFCYNCVGCILSLPASQVSFCKRTSRIGMKFSKYFRKLFCLCDSLTNKFRFSILKKNQNQINPWIFPQMLLLGHCSLSYPSLLGFSIQVQFSSVAQSYPTLCDPMDCSTPGFPEPHQLPELAQTHVHQVGDAIQPSHPLSSPSPPAFNLSQHQGLFKWLPFCIR